MKAERKYSASTLKPDLDNANVGSQIAFLNLREIPLGVSRFFYPL